MEFDQLLAMLDLEFQDRDLLLQALTHRSFVNEQNVSDVGDNERLEFLGDAVLDFIVGDMLYRMYPDMPEGDLTRLRAALVRTESFAGLAQSMGLGAYLRMGKGEENTGGRERATNLCAALEATMGALYLDQGLKRVTVFMEPWLHSLLKQVLSQASDRDARSLLQEWSQSQRNVTPVYTTVDAIGPDHQKEFVVEVSVGDLNLGRGTGRSKQAAAQAAARDALRRVQQGKL
jgi:ribonuclease III